MLKFRVLPFILAIALFLIALLLEFAGAKIGLALGAMAIFDLMVLLTLGLIAAPLVFGNAFASRVQGAVTFGTALAVLALAARAIAVALFLTIAMFDSLVAVLPYLVAFAYFPVGAATAVFAAVMACKVGFALALIVAHPKFLENTGLILIVGLSLALGAMVGALHAFPVIMVSITDAIGALVILVVAALRALGFLIGALPAIKKALNV